MPDVTVLLARRTEGDKAALDEMLPIVYDELRNLARHYLRNERPGHTLQTTELVHEAYSRLVPEREVDWQNRAHFMGVAARAMRRVLLNHAETRSAQKRSGYTNRVPLDVALECIEKNAMIDILAIDHALERLAQLDDRQARIVEMRIFAGLTIEEAAEATGLSVATVKRDWAVARLWLWNELAAQSTMKVSSDN